MAKRSNGEGCIVKTANGKWSARIQIGFKTNGKPKIKTFSGDTRKEATEKLNAYRCELERIDNMFQGSSKLNVSMKYWMETYKRIYLKPSSYDRLEVTIDSNILPYIGNEKILDIKPSIIQERVINALSDKGLSYSSIKKAYNALNGFFRQCMYDNIISKNPMLGVKLPPSRNFDKKTIRTLSEDEIERFIVCCIQKYKSVDKLVFRNGYAYIAVLYTGIRISEAMAIKWSNIDFENRVLHICGNIVTVKDRGDGVNSYIQVKQNSTKSSSGIRDIPLCKKALEALKEHKKRYYDGKDDYIFLSKNGTLLLNCNFVKTLNLIYKKAGIEASGAHILRHTFASMLFAKGVDVKIISKILGHSKVDITYNEYIHLIEAQQVSAIDLLDVL